jgi:hypothetical protein
MLKVAGAVVAMAWAMDLLALLDQILHHSDRS